MCFLNLNRISYKLLENFLKFFKDFIIVIIYISQIRVSFRFFLRFQIKSKPKQNKHEIISKKRNLTINLLDIYKI